MANGRLLVVQEAVSASSQPIWDEISSQGYDIVTLPLDGTAQAVRHGLRPDAVILDMIAAEMSGTGMRYRAAAGRLLQMPERRLPVLSVGDGTTDSMPIGVAEILGSRGSIAATQLIRRIAALSRLSAMHAEHQRRIRTARAFDVTLPEIMTSLVENDAEILVVGTSRRFLAIEAQLSRQAIVTGATSPQTAFDYLDRRAFDAIVVDLAAAPDFLTDLRGHPEHFDMPVIAVSEPENFAALVASGATDVVEDGDIERSLARMARGLVSEQRLRRTLRAAYSRGRHLETNDSLTGLYSRGFLMAHLDQAREDALGSGDTFAVCGLRLPLLAGINAEHGYAAGDRILRQVGLMAGRLSRAEDLVARYGAHFVLVMPGTSVEDGMAPVRRISGIVRATDLVLPEGGTVRVDLDTRLLPLDPEEPVERLMQRLFD